MSDSPEHETSADDAARTSRLLTHLQTSYLARAEVRQEALEGLYIDAPSVPPLPLDEFERVVLAGALPLHDATYPPVGHSYPRRGN
ncbi:hypothetical protein ACFY9Y_35075 [Streptomyces fimicarius]|uniref:hypothetical protein n=1 Tax=Streptomyces griseus TaxID=1911 RepID=UPI0036E92592